MSGAVAVLATGYAQDALFTDILLTLRDPCVRAELIRDWRDEATQAFGAMQGQWHRPLLRSGVLSGVLATYRYAPPHAAQFWPAVCQDSRRTEGMPARALVHFLLTTPKPHAGRAGVCAPCGQRLERLLRTARSARWSRVRGRIRSGSPGRCITGARRGSIWTRPGSCSTRRCPHRSRRRRHKLEDGGGADTHTDPAAQAGGGKDRVHGLSYHTVHSNRRPLAQPLTTLLR